MAGQIDVLLQDCIDKLVDSAFEHKKARNLHRRAMQADFERLEELQAKAEDLGIKVVIKKAKGKAHGKSNS